MFEPENDFERSLIKAATDPGHRPQFYRDLLDSQFYVVTVGQDALDIKDGVAQEEANVQLQVWEREDGDWLPVFSSLPRLQENLDTEAEYLRLTARDFFEMTQGANVALNPNLDYGKEFTADEIESLLDGSIFDD